jgi:hypothetical protein
MRGDFKKADPNYYHVQDDINRDQQHCDSDRFFEAAQKDSAQCCDQYQCNGNAMMQKIHVLHHKRILDDVCRSISSAPAARKAMPGW